MIYTEEKRCPNMGLDQESSRVEGYPVMSDLSKLVHSEQVQTDVQDICSAYQTQMSLVAKQFGHEKINLLSPRRSPGKPPKARRMVFVQNPDGAVSPGGNLYGDLMMKPRKRLEKLGRIRIRDVANTDH